MPESSTESGQRFEALGQRCQNLRRELGQVILGQQAIVDELMLALLCQGHVLIVGVPGLAKTLLVRTLAKALDLQFRRIQFTPDLMPGDILGTELIQEDRASGERRLRFLPGPIFANLILADEINRTPPKTQAALLEAMAEGQVTVAGHTLPMEKPFLVVATQNPIEQEGTYPLPEAQLDRFLLSLWMDYPQREDELRIVAQTRQIHSQQVQTVFRREELLADMALIEQMPLAAHVVEYAVSLVRATRPADAEAAALARKYVEWGAGPRAGQFLVQAARARAALDGRPTPSCSDVAAIAPAVLRHRLVVNYAAAGEGIGSREIVAHVLETVKQPEYR